MKIQRLLIYPVKSILPVEVPMAEITAEGFRFDRQYLIAKAPSDPQSPNQTLEHLTIKTNYKLALFQPTIDHDWSLLTITYLSSSFDPSSSLCLTIPLTPSPLLTNPPPTSYRVSIFGTPALALDMGTAAATFFTTHLGTPCRLLFMSGSGSRDIPGLAYAPRRELTSLVVGGFSAGKGLQPQRIRFADAAPFLLTTTASAEVARKRLPPEKQQEDVILRFRPNIHVDVGEGEEGMPFVEDGWRELGVYDAAGGGGDKQKKATIRCVFSTPRCLSLNVDLTTGTMASRDNQLYGLLAKDRRVNKAFPHKPAFGQYAFAGPTGAMLRVGDEIRVETGTTKNYPHHSNPDTATNT